MELYVYYRVPVGQRAEVLAEVARRQAELATQWPGLQARLLCRADDDSETLTCMETYRRDDPLQAADCSAIEQALTAVPAQRIGARHVERFEPVVDAR